MKRGSSVNKHTGFKHVELDGEGGENEREVEEVAECAIRLELDVGLHLARVHPVLSRPERLATQTTYSYLIRESCRFTEFFTLLF